MSQKLTTFDSSKQLQIDIYKRQDCPLRVAVTSFEQEGENQCREKLGLLRSFTNWSALIRLAKQPKRQLRPLVPRKPLEFELYTLPGQTPVPNSNSRPSYFGVAEEVHPQITVESYAEIIQRWVKDCCENHAICSLQDDGVPFVPSRLLDLSGEQGELIRLVETMHFVNVSESYATLSHCWGNAHLIQTNRKTLQKHKTGIEICDLPKTFADVVTILRTLRIRYVWIDSLCIIQKDDIDWKEQAAQMARIYSKSCLNIAATAASDSTGGCLNTRSLRHGVMSDLKAWPINTSNMSYGGAIVYIRPSFHAVHQRFNIRKRNRETDPADHEITSLLSRAWIFQERQLAPRTIHFHPTELIMECKSGLRCECIGLENIYKTSRSKLADINSLDKRHILDRWLGLINEYSKLLITYDRDRLVALIGIAKIFQDRLESHYLAGIWLTDLARGLLWNVAKPLPFEKNDNLNIYRCTSESKFAPSWSWASLVSDRKDTPINFLLLYEDSFEAHSRFAYVQTNIPMLVIDSLKNPEPAYLIVRGLTISARLFHGYDKHDRTLNDTTLKFPQVHHKNSLGFALDCTLSQSGTTDGDEVCCLLVGTSSQYGIRFGSRNRWLHILVCKLYQDSGAYERLGICAAHSNSRIFRTAQENTLKLI
ncbi:30756bd5-8c28-40d7-a2aa-b063880c3169 [Sclerotinia trifoliorum]|uniref:30756bd5-8c28-40d7-a2aa-b063880c3169 n=1 Tax=Sclerotinia trifoliorum TaxID=28548 RepID=A0A8H2VTY5_9HELO|nr:30756bd5-8c28-40d7-a2aa-b063880c3169 [Sclerotinia trifoliorum]